MVTPAAGRIQIDHLRLKRRVDTPWCGSTLTYILHPWQNPHPPIKLSQHFAAWQMAAFTFRTCKGQGISHQHREEAISSNKTVTPGKMGLFWVDWFGMAAGSTMIYTCTELHSAETEEWTHGVWLVQDDTIRSVGRSLGQSVHLRDVARLELITGL